MQKDHRHLGALENIMQGVSNTYGEDFYRSVVSCLAKSIHADYTFIGRFDDKLSYSRTLALCAGTDLIDNFEYELTGTPCAQVAEESTCVYPNKVCQSFPHDQLLIDMGVEGYIGAPLLNRQREVIGLVVALYKNEIIDPNFVSAIFNIFAGRIAAEIENTEAAAKLDKLNQTLEQQVAKRTNALSQANSELTAFSYALSHDLRAPLRATSGIVEIINEDYYERLPIEAQLYFNQIQDSCQHMSSIIENMLNLAHISSKPLRKSLVNISSLCEKIFHRLNTNETDIKIDFSLDTGMTLFGDESLISIMLENIIGNAWKYSSTTNNAKISIALNSMDTYNRLTITDNGAGFNMDNADNIFQPFCRLHNDSEFEGSGIGMSTVKRIIDQHSASIQLNSEPNMGTTVTVDWPLATAESKMKFADNILVIEDNPVDFMLISRLIKKNLGSVNVFRAEDRNTCQAMLQKPWPLIISDCHINGAEAKEITSWISKASCDNYLLISGSPEEYDLSDFQQPPIALLNKSDITQISQLLNHFSH